MEDGLFDSITKFLETSTIEDDTDFSTGLLTEDQYKILVDTFVQTRGADNVTLDDTMIVVRWAEQAIIDNSLLGMIFKGLVSVDINDEGKIVFRATDNGRQVLRDGKW